VDDGGASSKRKDGDGMVHEAPRRRGPRIGIAVAAVLAVLAAAGPAPAAGPDGAGGPILVVVDPGDPFGRYHAEILRAEGLTEFALTELGGLSAQRLAAHDVVVLAQSRPTPAQVTLLSDWVRRGGNLVAMRPDPALAPLLGLGARTGELAGGYVGVDTRMPPGAGITGATMQFHGVADLWSSRDARAVATLYADAGARTASPAVTLRAVGTAGGAAAAFTYDLARSVVATRQGNVAWAGQKRAPESATAPIRSHDLFFPDWVDFDRIRIPQADEQQRLLANLITHMNLDRTPLPRLWYLPRGEQAAVVLTGDDHGNGGTDGQFDSFAAASPPGCSVADWECVRATSYMYPGGPLTDAQLAAYQANGFEVALHRPTFCHDQTPASLAERWSESLAAFTEAWPSLRAPRTSRSHCTTWSDWVGEPLAARVHGIRFDTNYYYFPASWVLDRPGLFTGSGMPMRFADADGSLIDVYQATTQLTDETLLDPPGAQGAAARRHITALLDAALGAEGFHGVFTANMHTDDDRHGGADAIVEEALARGVPVVSSEQMLVWLDGRNETRFAGLASEGGRLRFTLQPAPGARGLQAMVPAHSAVGALTSVTRDGAAVATRRVLVKGIEYAMFDGVPGGYVATYPPGPPAPLPPGELSGSARKAPAALRIAKRLRASRGGKVRARVVCRTSDRPCRVTITLRHRDRRVGRRRASVAAGSARTLAVRLSGRARRELADRGRLRLRVMLTTRSGEEAWKVTRRVTVLPARRR
jgi:hypothetical protein